MRWQSQDAISGFRGRTQGGGGRGGNGGKKGDTEWFWASTVTQIKELGNGGRWSVRAGRLRGCKSILEH